MKRLVVKAAEGGEDSKLLAADLAASYESLFVRHGWKHRIAGPLSYDIEDKAARHLEREVGGHRFQRIPPTEKRGRVHTSSVLVYVDDCRSVDAEIDPRDVAVSWFSGTGKGGQHRNKHQNCCRVTHRPTGLVGVGQSSRSRDANQREAMEALRAKLASGLEAEASMQSDAMRRRAGSGQRGDKIRTIRFQDDQAKDHRTGRTIPASAYMKGQMDRLW